MLRHRKVRFAGVGPQTKRGLDSRVRQRQTCGRVVSANEINEVVRFGQSAIGKEKCRVARDRLLKQMGGLEKILLGPGRIKTYGFTKSVGSDIKIVGHKIGRGRFLDRSLFTWRKLGLKLIGDRFGNLTLYGKHVGEVPVIGLRPEMRIGSSIDQLCVHPHFPAGTLHASFQ